MFLRWLLASLSWSFRAMRFVCFFEKKKKIFLTQSGRFRDAINLLGLC